MGFIVAITTCPNEEVAENIAADLLSSRLIACATLLPGATSLYRWQGAIHKDREIVLLLKSRRDNFQEIASYITKNHPYELPELIALPIEEGLSAYLKWLDHELTSPTP
ncbi:MAG: divalent-cation tolerance protein CutA [Gammaproteobacteria bacterium]|nr:divalent-cation tolerance protein CutA [Gammaproteobacteria bacterium]